MNLSRPRRLVVFLSLLCLLPSAAVFFQATDGWAQSQPGGKDSLNQQELNETQAVRFFKERRYDKALEAFKALTEEYPRDIKVKQYLGSCLAASKRDQEAIDVFKGILKTDPKNRMAHYALAGLYFRAHALDKAEGEYAFVLANTPKGRTDLFAKYQLGALRQIKIEKARKKPALGKGKQIAPKDFLKTRAVQDFEKGRYQDAVRGFEELEKIYPKSVLVKRYKGLSLDKLGRFDDALSVYQTALATVPGNVALHYALAQTLFHKKDLDGAKRELRYVAANDETGVYKGNARQALSNLSTAQAPFPASARKKPRKGSLYATGGAEWNSNPLLNTRLISLQNGRTRSAWRFHNSLGGYYELLRKGPWTVRATYDYGQSFYSASMSQLNVFLNIWGINASYFKMVKGRPLIVNLGHSTAYSVVKESSYSTVLTQSLSLIYSPKDWYRIILSDRWGVTPYSKDGYSANYTSREGFGNVVGIVNHFYFNKAKSLYLQAGFDYERDDTHGLNYIKNAYIPKVGIHFPLLFNASGEVDFQFKESDYPKYGFTSAKPGRHDEEYALGVNLTVPMARHWKVNGYYRLVDNYSRDKNFTYRNNILGFSLAFDY